MEAAAAAAAAATEGGTCSKGAVARIAGARGVDIVSADFAVGCAGAYTWAGAKSTATARGVA
jgi:hypothetical protein